MSKIQNHSYPNREVIHALRLAMASNRFIFTQGGIFLVVGIVLGAIPALLYGAAGTLLIVLALTFEKPYQLLRRLLPYGNWPHHLTAVPTRTKIYNIGLMCIVILIYVANLWIINRLLPLVLPSSTNLWCDGSLACMLLRHLLS
jgi:hypothetical protein